MQTSATAVAGLGSKQDEVNLSLASRLQRRSLPMPLSRRSLAPCSALRILLFAVATVGAFAADGASVGAVSPHEDESRSGMVRRQQPPRVDPEPAPAPRRKAKRLFRQEEPGSIALDETQKASVSSSGSVTSAAPAKKRRSQLPPSALAALKTDLQKQGRSKADEDRRLIEHVLTLQRQNASSNATSSGKARKEGQRPRLEKAQSGASLLELNTQKVEETRAAMRSREAEEQARFEKAAAELERASARSREALTGLGGVRWVRLLDIVDTVSASSTFDWNTPVDNILSDDGKFWTSGRGNTSTLTFTMKKPYFVSGIRYKIPKNKEGSAFKRYLVEYAADDDGVDWRNLGKGEGVNADCCSFHEILFSTKGAKQFRLKLESHYGYGMFALQYVEFQVTGRAPPPSPSKSEPYVIMGSGICADAQGNAKINHAIQTDGDCASYCAADPECPGYAGPDKRGHCMWYTDVSSTMKYDNSASYAHKFNINGSKQDLDWTDSLCYRKATPCPPFSVGYNFETGCECAAGFMGTISALEERPWVRGNCTRAPCPVNSQLVGGDMGVCICDEGYSGTIQNAYSAPHYSGECVKTDPAVWTSSTTTTSRFGARYWGLAAGSNTHDWYYRPHKFELFADELAHNNSLTAKMPLIGFFPASVKDKVYQPEYRRNNSYFLSVYSGDDSEDASWSNSWGALRKPLYYYDFGKARPDVRAAKHHCKSWKNCLSQAYVVYSHDLVTWYARLKSNELNGTKELINEPTGQGGRYWGVAAGRTSGSGSYSFVGFNLYESRDGSGDDLAADAQYTGLHPATVFGQTFRKNKDGTPMKTLSDEGSDKDWYLSWPKYKKPLFYVDLGSRKVIRSARHVVASADAAPAQTFIVSSNDGVHWEAQLVTQNSFKETVLDQRPAKCDTMACPRDYRPKDNVWDRSCFAARCRVGWDRDECCQPIPKYLPNPVRLGNETEAEVFFSGGGRRLA